MKALSTTRIALPALALILAAPAFAQQGRLPLPPSSPPPAAPAGQAPATAPSTPSFTDAYARVGRPAVAVVEFYTPDLTNDLSVQARLLGARAREIFRSSDARLIEDDAATRLSRDPAMESLGATDLRRAASLIGEQSGAGLVLAMSMRTEVPAGARPRLRCDAVLHERPGAVVFEKSYEVTVAPGKDSIDAERVSTFAMLIVTEAQRQFAETRAGAALVAPSAFSRPLNDQPLVTTVTYEPPTGASTQPVSDQQPVYVQQPVVVQQPVIVRSAPVYTQPVVIREPVYVQEPVTVPTSSWSVAVGYGWGSGAVGFGYASPGYCAPRYYAPRYCAPYRPAYCGPAYGGWGGYGWGGNGWCGSGSSVAFSIGFSSGGCR